jgi:putative ABC transport system permease protein
LKYVIAGGSKMHALWQDVRYGLRMLAKNPGFSLAAVLTLALGIGATSSVFSVVDRILFRSLPYPHGERLVSFGLVAPIEPTEFTLGTDYVEWRTKQSSFEAVTSMRPGVADCDLTEQNPIRLSCAAVEASFLPTFEIQPVAGRNFTVEEDRPKARPAALLSYGLWRSRFGGNPGVVGKTIPLNGSDTEVAGVLPADFEMPNLAHVDILLPEALDLAQQVRPNTGAVLRSFARLKRGVNVAQATAGLQPLFEESLKFVPEQFRKEVRLRVRSLRDRQVGDAKLTSWVLLGSVFAVLLVACTNVASLLLARVASRRRELAVRSALGASPTRLLQQSFTESLLLGLLGGAVGCLLAYLFLQLFVALSPEGIPRLQQARLDLRVAGFTVGLSILSGVLFGLAPALYRPSAESLSGKEVRGTKKNLLRQTLVAAQIAVSLVLLTGAGLLLRSLWNMETSPLGMEKDSVVTAEIALGAYRYPEATQQIAFFDRLQARLRQLPGVTSLALSDTLPPSGGMRSTIFARIEKAGYPRMAEGTGGMVGWRAVTPGYFPALGISILRGRAFREADLLPTDNPVILNEALARELFPNEDALGKQLRMGFSEGVQQEPPWRTVVGIAANVKNNGITEQADPEYYVPWKESPDIYPSSAHVIVRTPLNAGAVAQWIRMETASIDATLPVKIETMSQRVGTLTQRPRFQAVLLAIFAGMGVLLAAIGIYGVVGYLVTQRTQEIGVRIALGATPGAILKLVMQNAARWTIAGALLGVAGSWFGARLLESLLFEVKAHDPGLLGGALLLLIAVAMAAAWVPARWAMRVDPIEALRYE